MCSPQFCLFPTNFGLSTHGMDQTAESEESWLPRSLFVSGAYVFLCIEELKQFAFPSVDASSSPYFSLDWCCSIGDVSELVTFHLYLSFYFINIIFLTFILKLLQLIFLLACACWCQIKCLVRLMILHPFSIYFTVFPLFLPVLCLCLSLYLNIFWGTFSLISYDKLTW